MFTCLYLLNQTDINSYDKVANSTVSDFTHDAKRRTRLKTAWLERSNVCVCVCVCVCVRETRGDGAGCSLWLRPHHRHRQMKRRKQMLPSAFLSATSYNLCSVCVHIRRVWLILTFLFCTNVGVCVCVWERRKEIRKDHNFQFLFSANECVWWWFWHTLLLGELLLCCLYSPSWSWVRHGYIT